MSPSLPSRTCDICAIMDVLEIGVVICNHEGKVNLWNHWMTRHSGLSAAETKHKSVAELFPETAGRRIEQAIDQALKYHLSAIISPSLHRPLLKLYARPQDKERDRRMQLLLHVIPMDVEGKPGCMIQISDMSATVRRERRLRTQTSQLRDASYRDALTNIGNRRKFDESLAEEFRRAHRTGQPLALIMADIDFFKRYNDHYGHQRGDDCLFQVARALEEGLRQSGDQVCRYGGEEFAIILPNTDEAAASLIAERLRLLVESRHLRHEDSSVSPNVTISLGVAAQLPTPDADFSNLITAADMALYHAKQDGRNRAMLFSMDSGNIKACQ